MLNPSFFIRADTEQSVDNSLNLRFTGTVIPGNGRGKGLGFPTANLAVEDDKPGDGVYSAWVQLADRSWVGATVSVGSNPTFKNVRDRRMECHLHDHRRDIDRKSTRLNSSHV